MSLIGNPLLLDGVSGVDPRKSFDIKLYTGNGGTQTISGLGFSPDLVWTKCRSFGLSHIWMDTLRGTGVYLRSNSTGADEPNTNVITSFNSDGFTLGSSSASNLSPETYAAWCWDAGSSTVTNTAGSISSQVRANASAGFSVVTYTSNGTNGATIGHGLGIAPQFVIVKNRLNGTNWTVGHQSLDATSPWNYYMLLNSTNARAAASVFWNNTSPSSSVITLGTSTSVNSIDGDTYVAYCFAPVAGISAFGSYTGNGSATGPTISGLGFQPYFLMIKASSTTGDWWMYDAVRSTANPRTDKLLANSSAAEDTAGEDVDLLNDGFQIKSSASGINQNAATYVYAAFA